MNQDPQMAEIRKTLAETKKLMKLKIRRSRKFERLSPDAQLAEIRRTLAEARDLVREAWRIGDDGKGGTKPH